jgi:hypothetical protein
LEVNLAISNEPLAKTKSWELFVYRKARRKASKKTHRFSNQAFCRWIGFSEDEELGDEVARDLPAR